MDELDALKALDEAFSNMNGDARLRTFRWLAAKYSFADPTPAASSSATPRSTKAHAIQTKMTAKAVATALGVNSGSDLLYAACAFLSIIQQQETFTRQAILEAMKSAVGFYKPSYNNNLSNYLSTICEKGVLIEVEVQVYTVKAAAASEMEQKLAAAV